MGEFPNKATTFKSGERQVSISRKGGLANKNNPNQILAQKLRKMREMGEYSPEQIDWLEARLKDPTVSAFHLIEKLDDAFKRGAIQEKDYLHLAGVYHKLRHGDKIDITNRVVAFNVEMKQDESQELLELLRKQKT